MDWSRIFNIGLVPAYIEQNPNMDGRLITFISIAAIIVTSLVAYLLGSLNFAILISRTKHDDIREHGSKNAGTTNMLRTYGKKMAVITLVGDFLKAVVAVLIGSFICMGMHGTYVAAFFCVLGHVFPIYYKFKGGKGIATAAGAILACGEWLVLLILLAIFAIIVIGTKYVSLASIMVALLYPVILQRFYIMRGWATAIDLIMAVAIALLVFCKHIPNLKRLLDHTERKVSFGKKKSESNGTEPAAEPAPKKSLHPDNDEE